MPILDVSLPAGVLDGARKTQLAETLTRALLKYEGYPDPTPVRLSTAWVYFHEFASGDYTSGGALHLEQRAPRYRVVVTVPQGVLSQEAKNGLVGEVTTALLGLEGAPLTPENGLRVYCLINELHDGNWGASGRALTLADMAALARQIG